MKIDQCSAWCPTFRREEISAATRQGFRLGYVSALLVLIKEKERFPEALRWRSRA